MTEYDWRTGLDFEPDDGGATIPPLDPNSLVVENLRLQAEVAASQRAVELGEASLRRLTTRLLEAERQAFRATKVDAAMAALQIRLEELQAEVAAGEALAAEAAAERAEEAERRQAEADLSAVQSAPPAGPRTRARNLNRRLRRLAAGP